MYHVFLQTCLRSVRLVRHLSLCLLYVHAVSLEIDKDHVRH